MIGFLLRFVSFLKACAGMDTSDSFQIHYVIQLRIFILLNSAFFMFIFGSIPATLKLFSLIPIFFILTLILSSFKQLNFILLDFLALLCNCDLLCHLILIKLSKFYNYEYYFSMLNNVLLNFLESSTIYHNLKGNHKFVLHTNQYV